MKLLQKKYHLQNNWISFIGLVVFIISSCCQGDEYFNNGYVVHYRYINLLDTTDKILTISYQKSLKKVYPNSFQCELIISENEPTILYITTLNRKDTIEVNVPSEITCIPGSSCNDAHFQKTIKSPLVVWSTFDSAYFKLRTTTNGYSYNYIDDILYIK